MYYSENARKKKVEELKNNQEFIDYAKQRYKEYSWGCETFEEFLIKRVFELYDNFELLQFLNTADQKTVDKVLTKALKGLDF